MDYVFISRAGINPLSKLFKVVEQRATVIFLSSKFILITNAYVIFFQKNIDVSR